MDCWGGLGAEAPPPKGRMNAPPSESSSLSRGDGRVHPNDYLVPLRVAQRHGSETIEVRVDEGAVRMLCEGKQVACSPRCYVRPQQIIDRSHDNDLWESPLAVGLAALERGLCFRQQKRGPSCRCPTLRWSP